MAPISIKKPSAPVVDPRTEGLKSANTSVVLATAGDVLRRQQGTGKALVDQANAAIAKLSREEVQSVVRSMSVQACRAEVTRAAEEAFEAAFADGPEERSEFAKSALEALSSRDRLESTLVATRTWSTHHGVPSQSISSQNETIDLGNIPSELAKLDGDLGRSLGRSLTGINAERRAALADLDPSERDRAVWFGSFLDADDLLQALAGTRSKDLSEGAKSALAASSLPSMTDSADASALARVAMQTISHDERAVLQSRAERSSALAQDLAEAERPYELEEPES